MEDNLSVENDEAIDIDRLIMDSVNYSKYNFVKNYPDSARSIHPTKNHDIDFSKLTYNSEDTKVNWICLNSQECGCIHEYLASPRTHLRYGCPFCSGRKVCLHKSIYYLFSELMNEWHPTKNDHLDPKTISRGSGVHAWWICSKKSDCGCIHEYECEIKGRTLGDRGCPFCSSNRLLCEHQSFGSLFSKLALEWHPTKNGNITPYDVLPGSSKKIWWLCDAAKNVCGCLHEYEAILNHRTKSGGIKGPTGCPFCSKPASRFCEHNSFEALHSELAKEWHPTKNGNLKPNMVSRGTDKSVWWLADCGHEFEMKITERTTQGHGCNLCIHPFKCEKIICDYLISVRNDVIKGFNPNWCRNGETGRLLPFDFLIKEYDLILELDGEQHFKNVKLWRKGYKETQTRDIYKMVCANERGYSMIRIKRNDVYKNLIDWKSILLEHIKSYDKVTNIFITRDDAYKEYIKSVENPIIINPPLLRTRHKKTLKIQRDENVDEDEDENVDENVDDMIEDIEKVDEEIKECEADDELEPEPGPGPEPEPEPKPELKPKKKIESETTKIVKHTKSTKEINATESTKSAKTADTIQLVKSNKPKKNRKVLKVQKHYD